MNKIFVIANSQGTTSGVTEGESYPYLLQRILPDYHYHFFILSGGSIREFETHIGNILLVNPDLVIFQIGIMECARRILSETEKKVLKKLPLGWMITKKLHDHRKWTIQWRNRFNINSRKMTPGVFRDGIRSLSEKLNRYHIQYLFLEIPYFSPQYEREYYPLINEDIHVYNQIIGEFNSAPIVYPEDDLYSIWQQGTVHFNKAGHQLVAERIKKIILEVHSKEAIHKQ